MLVNMQVLSDVTQHTDVSHESSALIFTVETMMANVASKRHKHFPWVLGSSKNIYCDGVSLW